MNRGATQGDIILSAKQIMNRFGAQTVHHDVSLEIRRGEIVGIAGGSGSGKSVLLKTMAGLHTPNKGEVRIDDRPIGSLTPAESAAILGVLFQEGALFSSLTVAQNIMLPLREYTALSETDQQQLAQLKLALVGLEPDTAVKYPAELSGGMTRRAAMARALAMDPLILFLDEPTSGLDPINASAFDQMILDLNRSLHVTVVMVTHDVNTLLSICDRVAVLADQQVILDTVPHLLKKDHPWIQEFFHGPRGEGAIYAANHTEALHGNR
jgi:phospholipid/cholesterol/gamma-HCH transport system ATP-binding protein